MMSGVLNRDYNNKLIHTLYLFDTSEAASKYAFEYFSNYGIKVIPAGTLEEII